MKIAELKEQGLLLFEVIRGSHAYGLNTPSSDIDKSYIYITPFIDLLKFDYPDQINEDNNDVVAYEISKFLRLLKTSNPTVVELLFTPDDCILYKHPIMDEILKHRDKFISKKLKNSLLGYGIQQVRKATGQQKMMHWEKEKLERKMPLDFIYAPYKDGSIPIIEWLRKLGLKQEYCGLVSINNMRYTYGVYYDVIQHFQREKIKYQSHEYYNVIDNVDKSFYYEIGSEESYQLLIESDKNLKYKGILKNVETSNDISLSETPKYAKQLTIIQFNKDGYSSHYKLWREYQEYLKNRNLARYVDNKTHGQKFDSKNLMHLARLVTMASEVADTGKLIVRRSPEDKEYLLTIRRGEVDLEEILAKYEAMVPIIENSFENSTLPDDVDSEYVENLLIDVRKKFYNI